MFFYFFLLYFLLVLVFILLLINSFLSDLNMLADSEDSHHLDLQEHNKGKLDWFLVIPGIFPLFVHILLEDFFSVLVFYLLSSHCFAMNLLVFFFFF